MFFSDAQEKKAASSIEVTDSGMFMFVNDSHPLKVFCLMEVSELESVIRDNDLQFKNAATSIVVTESGMVMFVSDVQPEKAPSPIEVTDAGKDTLFNEEQPA